MAVTAAIDAVFTTQPGSPDARMRGTNAWMPWITPHRSTSITRCHSERGSSQELPLRDDAGVVHRTRAASRSARPRRRRRAPSRRDRSRRPPASAPRRRRRASRVGVLARLRLVAVGHEHAHARGDERLGGREPDPARRAGHDRGCDPSNCSIPAIVVPPRFASASLPANGSDRFRSGTRRYLVRSRRCQRARGVRLPRGADCA